MLGKFEELVPEKRIQQSWRLKNWSSGHYSNVVIDLEETVSASVLQEEHIVYISLKFQWGISVYILEDIQVRIYSSLDLDFPKGKPLVILCLGYRVL